MLKSGFTFQTDLEIHIWKANFKYYQTFIAILFNFLNKKEKETANQYLRTEDQNKFIIRRYLLKELLAHYLNCSPLSISLEYGPYGKPFIPNCSIQFSLSDSKDIVTYAFTKNREIGIDIEYLREVRVEANCSYLFSKKEQQALNSLDLENKNHVFLKLWTCKEAFLKAIGTGLHYPIQQIEVLQHVDARPRLTLKESNEQFSYLKEEDWSLHFFEPNFGYTSTIAFKNDQRPYSIIYHWIPDVIQRVDNER